MSTGKNNTKNHNEEITNDSICSIKMKFRNKHSDLQANMWPLME